MPNSLKTTADTKEHLSGTSTDILKMERITSIPEERKDIPSTIRTIDYQGITDTPETDCPLSVRQKKSILDSKVDVSPPIAFTPLFVAEDITAALTYLKSQGVDKDPDQLANFYKAYSQLVIGTLTEREFKEPFPTFIKHVYELTAVRLSISGTDIQINNEALNTIRLALFIAYNEIPIAYNDPGKQQLYETYRQMHASISEEDYRNITRNFKTADITPPEGKSSTFNLNETLSGVKGPSVLEGKPKESSDRETKFHQYITDLRSLEYKKIISSKEQDVKKGGYNQVNFGTSNVVLQGATEATKVAIITPLTKNPEQIAQHEAAFKLLLYKGVQHSAHLAMPLIRDADGIRVAVRAKSDLRGVLYLKATSSTQRMSYIAQMINGIALLHKNDIAHRDIKPDNMLVDEKGVLKISDFDTARPVTAQGYGCSIDPNTGKPGEEEDLKPTSIVGTQGYYAPELDKSGTIVKVNLLAADVHSLGISILDVIYYLPEPANPQEEFLLNSLKKLVSDMIDESPDKRPTMPDVQRRFKMILLQGRGSAYTNVVLNQHDHHLQQFSQDGHYMPMGKEGDMFNISPIHAIESNLNDALNKLAALDDDSNWKSASDQLLAAKSTERNLENLVKTIDHKIKEIQRLLEKMQGADVKDDDANRRKLLAMRADVVEEQNKLDTKISVIQKRIDLLEMVFTNFNQLGLPDAISALYQLDAPWLAKKLIQSNHNKPAYKEGFSLFRKPNEIDTLTQLLDKPQQNKEAIEIIFKNLLKRSDKVFQEDLLTECKNILNLYVTQQQSSFKDIRSHASETGKSAPQGPRGSGLGW